MFQGLTRGKETSGRNLVMNVHMMKPFLYELTFSENRRIRFGRFCSYESMKTLISSLRFYQTPELVLLLQLAIRCNCRHINNISVEPV